jgi:thioredoxin 1
MKNCQIFLLSFLISFATVCSYGETDKKTLLIFGADWCKYCSKAKNDIEKDPKLSEIVKQYEIIEIDYDKDQDVVAGHNIKTIPSFIVFQNGKEKRRLSGYSGPKQLLDFLK